jgi:hypothetical protein
VETAVNGLVLNELAQVAEQEHMRAALEREARRAEALDRPSRSSGYRGPANVMAAVGRALRAAVSWTTWPADHNGPTPPVLNAGARREAR